MGTRDTRIDAYIEKAAPFAQPILERVRAAYHKADPDIVETMKWSMPHFEHAGLVGGMAAFKAHVNLGFWRGAELEDPTGLFSPRPNSKQSSAKVATLKDTPTQAQLVKMIKQAVKLNEAGGGCATPASAKKKAKKKAKRAAPKMPPVLKAALAKHPKAKATFDGFPPSAKRDYIEWITEAKREATRDKRLTTTIEWLSEGKRRHWKYQDC